jgi:hypothetical protein
MSWGGNSASHYSANLIQNAGAEEGPGNDAGGRVDSILGWYIPRDGLALPTVAYYNGHNGLPSATDPGPTDRGNRFFAGGPSNALSGIRQDVLLDPDWVTAVDAGNVKFDLSAFLGGYLAQTDGATLKLTFLDANYQTLGETSLGPVTARERENKTGLWPVGADDYVPVGTRRIYVDLEFTRNEGDYNDGYADNLELTLQDYSQ